MTGTTILYHILLFLFNNQSNASIIQIYSVIKLYIDFFKLPT